MMSQGPYQIVMIEPTAAGGTATTIVGREETAAEARKVCQWAFDRFPIAYECRITDANGTVERVPRPSPAPTEGCQGRLSTQAREDDG